MAESQTTHAGEHIISDGAGIPTPIVNEAEKVQGATREQILASIAPHECFVYDAASSILMVTIDFTSHTSQFYLSPDFAAWRSSLLDTLPQHATLIDRSTTIIMKIIFPHYGSQSISMQRAQREVLKRIAKILDEDGFEKVKKLDAVLKAPEMHWNQVQGLAPFYELRVKRWRAFLKTRNGPAILVKGGDEWDVKLRKVVREMAEMREF